ncbi:glycosyltransferase N-terminal domain-containing protein [Tropicimonas sp. TH_r6]|uniref:3-deoxy-D-manno-octulosonic acid transferase n=1 Tax=Tropicimonas sp. TH_r6 TaxID=3082085 RepID=UPI002953C4B0|nr:glycosyltransferase N-terminal domain-containing protein [Tropicimonas sp. TH_r6]MDV7144680.1 glycosyltransferase N-terminal domain-containing protein [Tropicimonas sp. TH_r6]
MTLPNLRARLRSTAEARKLALVAQRGGEAGRAAAERLGRSEQTRPPGPLLWCHVPGMVEPGALGSLRERLEEDLVRITLLVTTPDVDRCREQAEAEGLICHYQPLDSTRVAQLFLDHWQPDAALWFEQARDPLLLEACAQRGVPLFLQNAVAPVCSTVGRRNQERRRFGLFQRVFALDPTEFEGIRGLGAVPARVEVTGRLTRIAHPPFCLEAERADLAEALRGRPVWLAACPDPAELPDILTAHRTARRVAHRLLLILVPRHEEEAPVLAAKLRADGWNVARRDADEEPDEATDIFIGDFADELGLYYRLAPITFLGGTLSNSEVPEAVHPATLGSAILAGPFSGSQAETLRRLRRGGACRMIADGGRLGPALAELMAPEKAALLALNAWDIASDGSPVLDRLVSVLLPVLQAGNT